MIIIKWNKVYNNCYLSTVQSSIARNNESLKGQKVLESVSKVLSHTISLSKNSIKEFVRLIIVDLIIKLKVVSKISLLLLFFIQKKRRKFKK